MAIEAVASNQGQPQTQTALDDVTHVLVEFRGDDLALLFEKSLGQRARARTDLENEVAGTDLGSIEQATELILVVQKILTHPMLGMKSSLIEDLSDFTDGLHVYQSYRTVYSMLRLLSAGTSRIHSIMWLSTFLPSTLDCVTRHPFARAMLSRTITF